MLIQTRLQAGIRDGSITVLFRRWRRPQALPGRRYRTPVGMLAVDTVAVVDPATISDADARRAGYRRAAEVVADLRGDPAAPTYRLEIRPVDGPDPRDELAAAAALDPAQVAEIRRRLDRLDRLSAHGPWTAATLAAIAARPGVRAAELAAGLGRDTLPFKVDVRKLKNLGLTHSLRIGYQLSPRGVAYRAAAG
jgi:hypothetical protein